VNFILLRTSPKTVERNITTVKWRLLYKRYQAAQSFLKFVHPFNQHYSFFNVQTTVLGLDHLSGAGYTGDKIVMPLFINRHSLISYWKLCVPDEKGFKIYLLKWYL
jgi:hypothetical protein